MGAGGGGGGGGGGTGTLASAFFGTWLGSIPGTGTLQITFNSNGSFTMILVASNTTIQGSYTATPPPSNTGQSLLTLVSQGQTLFQVLASFQSPGAVIFGVGTDNIPGATFATQVFFSRVG